MSLKLKWEEWPGGSWYSEVYSNAIPAISVSVVRSSLNENKWGIALGRYHHSYVKAEYFEDVEEAKARAEIVLKKLCEAILKKLSIILLVLLLGVGGMKAEERELERGGAIPPDSHRSGWRKAQLGSLGVFLTGNTMDIVSSIQNNDKPWIYESNKLMSSNGKFGVKGMGIKIAFMGGVALVNLLPIVRRNMTLKKSLTFANSIMGGVMIQTSIHNWGLN